MDRKKKKMYTWNLLNHLPATDVYFSSESRQRNLLRLFCQHHLTSEGQ